jgi:peptidoglycan hydrolase CwlO-like protein
MKKKIALITVIIIILMSFAFTGCIKKVTPANTDYDKRISNLEARVDQLQSKVVNLQSQLDKLQK